MILEKEGKFVLQTENSAYAFDVLPTGHLEHLYYGARLDFDDDLREFEVLKPKREFGPGNTISYDEEHFSFAEEDTCFEISAWGKGDLRSPFVSIIHHDGSTTCDFLYESHLVSKGKPVRKTLPGSYDENDNCETLRITLKDRSYDVRLDLYYVVFEDKDVIARFADLTNAGEEEIRVERLLSFQLDLFDSDYEAVFFSGAWAREMQSYRTGISNGMHISRSNTGTSSSRANPFFMIARENTDENIGECFGFNLIYSGNHMEITDANSFGKVRIQSGINDEAFSFTLKKDEVFEAPEAIMSFSDSGFNLLSRRMHEFVRENIVRGEWKKKERPVLLNSWEAAYFNFDENKLVKLAKKAAEVGIELFVMDDGWFGERNDDLTSLGDWKVNTKKIPGGLKGLADRINKQGLSFGIWVEPEMVNVKSRLYEAHPDWCLANPNTPHSEGRHQRILDLTKKEVRDYIIESMSEVFSSANIEYVKWDMNRILSDIYSEGTPSSKMGEITHRYVLGLYEIMGELTKRFPKILFEGCSSGGNRFDLGILCFFPQIWASDNTDPICRSEIQQGLSYGYPLSAIGAHVSASPNHQTLRKTPMKTRAAVASFACFGYECNLNDFSKEEIDEIKKEIALYKAYRNVMQFGTFYRGGKGPAKTLSPSSASVLSNPSGYGNITEWTAVSKDKGTAVGMMLKKLALPNTQNTFYRPKGLKEDAKYVFVNKELEYDIRDFGDLVNTVAPIHLKQNSLLLDIVAKKIKLPSEKENYVASGKFLCTSGVRLCQDYAGTGYNENVRYAQDFSAKMYIMEEILNK
ncbi:MAG: alpha-galactosidase [Lachnospiraceae bacterium]|nr:alpha-galactosidase [Lachnospiraceae bacterium]